MNWIEQHKAAIITLLITGIITFGMFSIHITQSMPQIAETFIDITPLTEEEETAMEEFLKQTKVTDKAFNEDASYKEMMQQFLVFSAYGYTACLWVLFEASAINAGWVVF